MKNQHTQEPWSINNWTQPDSSIAIGANGTPLIARVMLRDVSINEQKANADRIVACVNACEGIGTEYLERFGGTSFNDFKRVKGQRDELLNALHQISLASQNSMSSQRECGRIARSAIAKTSEKYSVAQIAFELERTAMGDGFYGNALRVAKDIPGVTDADRALLDRYATGQQTGIDHVALQDLALRIDTIAKATGGQS